MPKFKADPENQRPALLEYLEQRGWNQWRRVGPEELAGFCPLHRETKPSFFVNRRKGLFYCHGCGRGGDLLRLMQLWEGLSLGQARARRIWDENGTPVLKQAMEFYQQQLRQWPQAALYLERRGIHSPEVIQRMRIGYAPGACLRGHLESLGYSQTAIEASGLLNARGWDRFYRCLTFPLDGDCNLYGRAIDQVRHQFLPRPKGGLYGWEQSAAGDHSSVIVVEGLFDVASLWQAGFDNAVAALGAHLNRRQLQQLCAGQTRTIYLCLDADENGSGPAAAHRQRMQLLQAGLRVACVDLPIGHDPNSYFCSGYTAEEFQDGLEHAWQNQ